MRKMRSFIACFIAALTVVPIASPASAQEGSCDDWPWVYVWLLPPTGEAYVENENGTLTIRGDRALALVDYYAGHAERFVGCTADVALGAAFGVATPIADCLTAATGAILASPDPVARYVEVEPGPIARIHYGQALDDAVAIANCNGIVRYGD